MSSYKKQNHPLMCIIVQTLVSIKHKMKNALIIVCKLLHVSSRHCPHWTWINVCSGKVAPSGRVSI